MTRRQRRVGRPAVIARHEFPDGTLFLCGDTSPGRVSPAILGRGNPSGTLNVSGTSKAMLTVARKARGGV